MRDLLLLGVLLVVAVLTVRAPFIGLLGWIWLSLMNPQREVSGLLSGFGFNLYVAALTVLAWLASKERKIAPPNAVTFGLIGFMAWSTVTTITALEPARAFPIWNLTLKTVVLTMLMVTIIDTKARLQAVVWVMVVSIGYFSLKGGVFALLTGGKNHVYGAADSMIADNNALGLALLIFLPLLNYLRCTSQLAATRFACLATMALTVVAVIGTYSRGALLTLAAVIATYAIRSRTGVLIALFGCMVATVIPSFLPPAWVNRMSTIESADQDDSFMGRVVAWKMNTAIANERPVLGGGFYAGNVPWVAMKYSHGKFPNGKAAHSIYFEVLGDHGYVGLALYLAIIAGAWLNTWVVLGLARKRTDLAWAGELARMLQVSSVAFLIGGAALSMAYYDGELMLLALTAALLQVARRPAVATGAATAPKWKTAEPAATPAQLGAQVRERRKVGTAPVL